MSAPTIPAEPRKRWGWLWRQRLENTSVPLRSADSAGVRFAKNFRIDSEATFVRNQPMLRLL